MGLLFLTMIHYNTFRIFFINFNKTKGRSHLSSIRICGNKAYDIRRPMYDSDKVHTDINILSRYLREKQLKEKCEQSHEKSTENVATCK